MRQRHSLLGLALVIGLGSVGDNFATCLPTCSSSKTASPLAALDPCGYDGTTGGDYVTVWRGNYCDGAEGTGTHAGVDLRATTGTTVRAIADGVVVKSYNNSATQCQLVCDTAGNFQKCDCSQESDGKCIAPRTTSPRDNSNNGEWGRHVVLEHIVRRSDGVCMSGKCVGGALPGATCLSTPACNVARYYSVYAHLDTVNVVLRDKSGGFVKALCGQQIGTVGKTGCATGSHLHFQIDREIDIGSGITSKNAHPIACSPPWTSQCDQTPNAQYFSGGDRCQARTVSPMGTLQDLDGDGVGSSGGDCDETDALSHPGAQEGPPGDPTCADGIDNDCDGHIDAADAKCNASWVTRTPMPVESDVQASAVAGDGALYAIGIQQGGAVNPRRTFRYDPASNSWTTRQDAPFVAGVTLGIVEGGAAAVGSKVYAIGEKFFAGNPIMVYDTVQDSWAVGPSDPNPDGGAGPALAVSGGNVYVIGGFAPGDFSTATRVDVFVPSGASGAWVTPISPLNVGRGHAATAVLGSTVYVLGGIGGQGVRLTQVESYDTANAAAGWVLRRSMLNQRAGAAADAINGRIYVVGGQGGANLRTVERYDPTSDSWIAIGSTNVAHAFGAGGVSNGFFYVAGGQTDGGGLTNVTEQGFLP